MGDEEEKTEVEEAAGSPVDEEAVDKTSGSLDEDVESVQPESEVPSPSVSPEPVKEGKPTEKLGSKVKNWVIILLLLMIITTLFVFFFWRTGLSDLKDDQALLVVVEEKGVAKAASIYDMGAENAEAVNIDALPPLEDKKGFLKEASTLLGRNVDKLIVVRAGTIERLSTEPSLSFNGKNVPSRDVSGYLSGALHDETLRGADPDWMFRGKMLSEWIEVYDDSLLSASFGSTSYNVITGDFRAGGITVYPRNYALLILKYIPVEQIFL